MFGPGCWERVIRSLRRYIGTDIYGDLFLFLLFDYHPAHISTLRRLSLANGIPNSYPFLDYDLLLSSQRLPPRLRYRLWTKRPS